MARILYTGGGTPGDWTDGRNWHGGVAPGVNDTAFVNGGSAQTVGGAISVANVMLIGGEAVTFDGTVNSSGVAPCTGFMVCVNAAAMFAPGSVLNDGGVFQVGVNGVGAVTAQGSGGMHSVLNVSGNASMGVNAAGNGTLVIDNATLNDTGNAMWVGFQGAGTLDVTDGGTVTLAGNLASGFKIGSAGTITLATTGMMTVGGSAAIGGGDIRYAPGTAALTVDAGSIFDVKHQMVVTAGSRVTLAGGTVSAGDTKAWLTVQAGATIAGQGTLATRTGGMVEIDGVAAAQGGTLAIQGNIYGGGTVAIGDNSTVAITAAVVTPVKFDFMGADATLSLAHNSVMKGELDDFTFGDQITMAGIDRAVWNSAKQLLVLSQAGHTVEALHVVGSYAHDVFTVTQSGGLGVITLHMAPH